jgi:hydroxymethylbilane synthase
LNTLGGGCQVPIGAYAVPVPEGLLLHAVVVSPDGQQIVREQGSGANPEKLGIEVGRVLLGRGAGLILNAVYGSDTALPQQP